MAPLPSTWNPRPSTLDKKIDSPAGRLPETENKRIYQISGPKKGRGRFGNSGSCRLRESF